MTTCGTNAKCRRARQHRGRSAAFHWYRLKVWFICSHAENVLSPEDLSQKTGHKDLFLMHSGFSALEPGGRACLHEHLSFENSLGAPMKNGLARIFGRILLTLGGLAAAGFLLLVLIGFGDRYKKETKALGFSGLYERYRASGAGFPNARKDTVKPPKLSARGKGRVIEWLQLKNDARRHRGQGLAGVFGLRQGQGPRLSA